MNVEEIQVALDELQVVLEQASTDIGELILVTPTSDQRNKLADANINVLAAQQDLKALRKVCTPEEWPKRKGDYERIN